MSHAHQIKVWTDFINEFKDKKKILSHKPKQLLNRLSGCSSQLLSFLKSHNEEEYEISAQISDFMFRFMNIDDDAKKRVIEQLEKEEYELKNNT